MAWRGGSGIQFLNALLDKLHTLTHESGYAPTNNSSGEYWLRCDADAGLD